MLSLLEGDALEDGAELDELPAGADEEEELLPGAVGDAPDDFGVVVVVSVRLVDEVPVFGRSHAAIPKASNAGSATIRIRFTRFLLKGWKVNPSLCEFRASECRTAKDQEVSPQR